MLLVTMFRYCVFILVLVSFVVGRETKSLSFRADNESVTVRISLDDTDKVTVKLYYESLCPGSKQYYVKTLLPAVRDLSDRIDLETLPFGNAQIDDTTSPPTIKCQHGPTECYGNKLHACSIDILNDVKQEIEYNACMMSDLRAQGSDDAAADQCGKKMNIDAEPIKKCAKSQRGEDLHLKYGRETLKISLQYVPYMLLNGQENDDQDLKNTICNLLKNPPKTCNT